MANIQLLDQLYSIIGSQEDKIQGESVNNEAQSEIQQFYDGLSIFVTGATGFVGKALVEKLLRGCPGISKIFILIRPKKKLSAEQRLDKFFNDMIFEKVQTYNKHWRKKVIPVTGDITKSKLGLEQDSYNIIVNEVNIIFHSAATINPVDALSRVLKCNVFSTREILLLAKQCIRLKAFVYVSTAYSHCYESVIEEKFYPTPVVGFDDVNAYIESLEGADEELTKKTIGKWPIPYMFSKAMAENLIRDSGQNCPVGVFRPSLVITSYREPIRGWCCSWAGPVASAIASGLGLLHIELVDLEKKPNLISIDMCVNGLITTAKDIADNFKASESHESPVYNYATNNENCATWREYISAGAQDIDEYPPLKAFWFYSKIYTKYYLMYTIVDFFLHFIPALLYDLHRWLTGKPPMAVKIYRILNTVIKKLADFRRTEWTFEIQRCEKMYDRMNEVDSVLFFCDVRKLSWEDQITYLWRGLRVYILKDPMDTLEAARKKREIFVLLYRIFLIVVVFLILYYVLYPIVNLFV